MPEFVGTTQSIHSAAAIAAQVPSVHLLKTADRPAHDLRRRSLPCVGLPNTAGRSNLKTTAAIVPAS
jgi:hypothetical protein